ncbi:MAG: hypothetical protein K6G28_06720 [Acholeplasmatales bacterium]|nr:hypothetical protein [Acholeplasmatales bacterium]
MRLNTFHFVRIKNDYKELHKGDILYAKVNKDNLEVHNIEEYGSYINPLINVNHSFKVLRNGNILIPLKELEIDHMEPKLIKSENLSNYLNGNITYDELTGYLPPNNGFIIKEKFKFKLKDLALYLDKLDSIDDFDCSKCYDIAFYDKKLCTFLDGKMNWDYDLFFNDETNLVALFLWSLDQADRDNYIYTFEQIKESINDEVKYLNKESPNHSFLVMSYFVETHSQESNYFMFNKIPNLLDTYKKYLDILIEKDDKLSLEAKAYLDYEGAFFWPVNYKEAEELLLRLYDKGDIEACNTLGYLYYYHLIDYDKAFKFFSIAAINGNVEATYKLSDCLKNGYGCLQNEIAAFRTIERLYDKTKIKFLEQKFYSKFPDVAFRFSQFHSHKSLFKDEELSSRTSKREIVEAKCAIVNRMYHLDYIGDNEVYLRILSEYNKYTFDKPEQYYDIDSVEKLDEVLSSAFLKSKNVYFKLSPLGEDRQVLKIYSTDPDRLFMIDYVDYGDAVLSNSIYILGYSNNQKTIRGNVKDLMYLFTKSKDKHTLIVKSKNVTFFLVDPYLETHHQVLDKGKRHKIALCLQENQKLREELPIIAFADGFDLKVNDRVTLNTNFVASVYKIIDMYEGDMIDSMEYYPMVVSKEDSELTS